MCLNRLSGELILIPTPRKELPLSRGGVLVDHLEANQSRILHIIHSGFLEHQDSLMPVRKPAADALSESAITANTDTSRCSISLGVPRTEKKPLLIQIVRVHVD